jgi:hypothetical protein
LLCFACGCGGRGAWGGGDAYEAEEVAEQVGGGLGVLLGWGLGEVERVWLGRASVCCSFLPGYQLMLPPFKLRSDPTAYIHTCSGNQPRNQTTPHRHRHQHQHPNPTPNPQLTGHLKLLGAVVRRPATLLLLNCDAALSVDGGAALFELVRKLVVLLPRATVLLSCSADTRQFVADCVDVLPVAGGSAGPQESRRYEAGGGVVVTAQMLRLRARGGGFGVPWGLATMGVAASM